MMTDRISELLAGPLLVPENRVRRTYKGGALIDRFRGAAKEVDGFYPEDWLGSTTQAVNRDFIAGEGISKVVVPGATDSGPATELSLREVLADPGYTRAVFGRGCGCGHTPGVLVKLLDSCTTLTLQTHPDRDFVHKHLQGSYGKCESWIVLGGRTIDGEKPFVYYGFRDGVTEEGWAAAYYEQDVPRMKSLLNKIYVEPGDVFFVEPNIIHAIGPGVFMLEVQEPSDYVFNFDRQGTYWHLTAEEMHMGLGEEMALASINYSLVGQELLKRNRLHVDFLTNHGDVVPILQGHMQAYFGLDSITSARTLTRRHTEVRIGIVLRGRLDVSLQGRTLSLGPGDTYMLPAPQGAESTCGYSCSVHDDSGFFSVLEAFPT